MCNNRCSISLALKDALRCRYMCKQVQRCHTTFSLWHKRDATLVLIQNWWQQRSRNTEQHSLSTSCLGGGSLLSSLPPPDHHPRYLFPPLPPPYICSILPLHPFYTISIQCRIWLEFLCSLCENNGRLVYPFDKQLQSITFTRRELSCFFPVAKTKLNSAGKKKKFL